MGRHNDSDPLNLKLPRRSAAKIAIMVLELRFSAAKHPRAPGVAVADYVSTSSTDPFAKL